MSRLWSRYSSDSWVALIRSLPLATNAVSAADKVSPAPMKLPSNISKRWLASTACWVDSTLSRYCSGKGMPVTST
ncbi:hypothetical protein D3C86_1610370 [compost metagenome]